MYYLFFLDRTEPKTTESLLALHVWHQSKQWLEASLKRFSTKLGWISLWITNRTLKKILHADLCHISPDITRHLVVSFCRLQSSWSNLWLNVLFTFMSFKKKQWNGRIFLLPLNMEKFPLQLDILIFYMRQCVPFRTE